MGRNTRKLRNSSGICTSDLMLNPNFTIERFTFGVSTCSRPEKPDGRKVGFEQSNLGMKGLGGVDQAAIRIRAAAPDGCDGPVKLQLTKA